MSRESPELRAMCRCRRGAIDLELSFGLPPQALVAAGVCPLAVSQPVQDAHKLAAPTARAGGHRVRPPGDAAARDLAARLADEFRDGHHVRVHTRVSFESSE